MSCAHVYFSTSEVLDGRHRRPSIVPLFVSKLTIFSLRPRSFLSATVFSLWYNISFDGDTAVAELPSPMDDARQSQQVSPTSTSGTGTASSGPVC